MPTSTEPRIFASRLAPTFHALLAFVRSRIVQLHARTAAVSEEKITQLIREHFVLTPKGIIEALDLRRPIYKPTAAYGHFGRTGPGFTWEKTDRADALRKAAGLGAVAGAEVGAR